MKTLKTLNRFLILSAAVLVMSCSSDSDGGGGGGSAPEGTLKANAGGSSFTSMVAQAQKVNAPGIGWNVTVLGTTSTTSTARTINFNLLGLTEGQTGTFEINSDSTIDVTASYQEAPVANPMSAVTWVAPYEGSGAAGEITITEWTDTAIKGNFHFTGKNQSGSDTKNVTNGVFNVNWAN